MPSENRAPPPDKESKETKAPAAEQEPKKNERKGFFSKLLNFDRPKKPVTVKTSPLDLELAKWLEIVAPGQYVEVLQGTQSCLGCKKPTNIYRQAIPSDGAYLEDKLRFEQVGEVDRVRCVLAVSAGWENDEFWSAGDDDKKRDIRSKNVGVKDEKFFASMQCVHCKEVAHFWIEKREVEGRGLRSFLCRREVKQV